ncbi:protein SERAC1 [Trichonephila clavipes]|nr:protein SERAC1 [Trichonephila clavipes]
MRGSEAGKPRVGLLVKQILVEAAASKERKVNAIAQNTTGVIFFSVPHKGSDLVKLFQSIPYILQPSIDMKHLQKGSEKLLSLHENFKNFVHQNHIHVLSFGELKKSKWGLTYSMLVTEDSSDPGLGEFYALPLDHLSTCKPESRESKVYEKTVEFLTKCHGRDSLPSRRVRAYQQHKYAQWLRNPESGHGLTNNYARIDSTQFTNFQTFGGIKGNHSERTGPRAADGVGSSAMNPNSVSMLMTSANACGGGQAAGPSRYLLSRGTVLIQLISNPEHYRIQIYNQKNLVKSSFSGPLNKPALEKVYGDYTRSSDLSPIVPIWDVIGRQLQPSWITREETAQLRRLSNNHPQEVIGDLIDSMPRPVLACIAARGGFTTY